MLSNLTLVDQIGLKRFRNVWIMLSSYIKLYNLHIIYYCQQFDPSFKTKFSLRVWSTRETARILGHYMGYHSLMLCRYTCMKVSATKVKWLITKNSKIIFFLVSRIKTFLRISLADGVIHHTGMNIVLPVILNSLHRKLSHVLMPGTRCQNIAPKPLRPPKVNVDWNSEGNSMNTLWVKYPVFAYQLIGLQWFSWFLSAILK